MKMGRLILVLSLVVVGVGCSKSESGKRTEGAERAFSTSASGECEVTKVEKWPGESSENPKLSVQEGDTIFVSGSRKSTGATTMRARLNSHRTRDYVVPLRELRNGNESLFYGIAPASCWDTRPDGEAHVMCVRCRVNVVPAPFWEPCCPVN